MSIRIFMSSLSTPWIFRFAIFFYSVLNPVPGTEDHKNTVFVDRYGEEDLAGAKSLVDQCPADDPDTEMNLACLLAKEGRLQVP